MVLSSNPVDGATDVHKNAIPSVVFSVAMDPDSVLDAFTLTAGDPAVDVAGTVIAINASAGFVPAVLLASNTTFTATIAAGVLSEGGVALDVDHVFRFTTGETNAAGVPVVPVHGVDRLTDRRRRHELI